MHDPEIDRHSRPRGIAVTCYLLLVIAIGCGKQRTDAPRIDDVLTADILPEQTIPAPVETKPRAGAASGAAKGTLQPASTTRRVRLRAPDMRPRHDPDALARVGIGTYESRRFRLHTDIEPEVAETLPPLMDAAYAAWEARFGPLPPDDAGRDFQMTGYLMRDQQLFRVAGLLPPRLRTFLHGRHRGQEFWMNDQEFGYYRRHLMIHEGTHCFMEALGDIADVPIWYLEGMAELFATHHVEPDGRVRFATMPERSEDYVGFGRIQMISRERQSGRSLSITDLRALPAANFAHEGQDYAWSWALCKFLDSHPRYREPFHHLARAYRDEGFHTLAARLFADGGPPLEIEWRLFVRHLCYGFDSERAAIDFPEARPCAPGQACEVRIAAGKGWQSSGVRVEAGGTYRLSADGEVVLALQPRPWISQPAGVSIHYAEGRPIGRLIGMVVADPPSETQGVSELTEPFDIESETTLTADVTGTLFLCVNDFWDQRADNDGQYLVQIRR